MNGADTGGTQSRMVPIGSVYNPTEQEAVDVYRLLDELEELPEKARHLPFNTLVGFNVEQFYYLVLKIRANLPEDMKRAQRISRDTERIVDEAKDVARQHVEITRQEAGQTLEQARLQAERLLAEAAAERDRLLQESEVMQLAKVQADAVIRQAEVEATEIRRGADDYARDVLANLEVVMDKALVQVQRGRNLLDESRR